MKCIYCDKDSRKSDRKDGRCPKCKRMFAFEPYEVTVLTCHNCGERNNVVSPFGNKCIKCGTKIKYNTNRVSKVIITDKAFAGAINAVSDGNTLFFTPKQLYYQLFRPRTKPRDIKIGGSSGGGFSTVMKLLYFLLIVGAIAGIIASGGFSAAATTLIGLGAVFALLAGTHITVNGLLPRARKVKTLADRTPLSYQMFKSIMLERWVQTHGLPPKMLPEGGRARPAGRQPAAPDVAQYSFDRLLVVDSDETADMLLANNLHFETNTPIVSINAYPQDVFENVMGMVRRNPNLKVFCLHDASPEGCRLPIRLREDPRWFPNAQITILDIGLRPRNVGKLTAMQIAKLEPSKVLPPDLIRILTQGERKWLESGNRGELAAIKPSSLMKSVYQTFRNATQEEQHLKQLITNDPRGFFQTALPAPPNSAPIQPLSRGQGSGDRG
jgi:hypothetical protein